MSVVCLERLERLIIDDLNGLIGVDIGSLRRTAHLVHLGHLIITQLASTHEEASTCNAEGEDADAASGDADDGSGAKLIGFLFRISHLVTIIKVQESVNLRMWLPLQPIDSSIIQVLGLIDQWKIRRLIVVLLR